MWRVNITRGACALLMTVAMSGCKGEKTEQKAAAPPPEVTVSGIVSRDVTDFAEFTGRMSAGDSVDIRARVSGYLNEIHFTDGQELKAGDVLFQIDPRPFQAALDNARGQKAQWEAKLGRAKADVQRYTELVPTGAATPQDLDKAKADMGEATAAIASAEATIARAQLDLDFSRVTAPLAGQVSKSAISKGNLVRGDTDVLTTIVSVDPINVEFDVNERDMLRMREWSRGTRRPGGPQPDIRELKIPVYLGLSNEQGHPHEGVIDFADNRVNPATGSIQARGVFSNKERIFKPGLFARVRVPCSDPYGAVLVSDRAIGTEQGVKYVLVVNDQNLVEQRFVQPGALQPDGLRVITGGLKAGERVVVNGLQRARPGKPVTPKLAEMPRHPGAVQLAAAATTTQSAPGGATAAPASH